MKTDVFVGVFIGVKVCLALRTVTTLLIITSYPICDENLSSIMVMVKR